MNKFLLLFCSVLLATSSSFAFTTQDEDPESHDHYITVEVIGDVVGLHRSCSLPFAVYYNSGSVVLIAYYNVGELSVSIVNTDTSESWTEFVDTSTSECVIDISSAGLGGNYELHIADGQGNNYLGIFSVE